jgi:hypothetical protein
MIEIIDDRDEKTVFQAAEEMAIAAAIATGADEDDVKIVQFDQKSRTGYGIYHQKISNL